MKVVAYSIKTFEKELLAKANQKKHDITLISNRLNLQTAAYAEGKEAVLVFPGDDVSEPVISRLAEMGVRHIATRSVETDHIDRETAGKYQIKLANVPSYSPDAIAEYTLSMALSLGRKLNLAKSFDTEAHVGFNFNGKTIGIVGLGNIGKAVAKIFNGLGCRVLANDIILPKNVPNVQLVSLEQLLREADIISLHVPLNEDTLHLIDREHIDVMKEGVMLLNTSRGNIIHMGDALEAIKSGKIGYLGMDAYQQENTSDQKNTSLNDPNLEQLLSFPNVLITSHQAFLTKEALQEMAAQTIRNLDNWHLKKCVGKACACAKSCQVDKANNP